MGRKGSGGGDGDADALEPPESPFAGISATMNWETFFLVQKTWLGTQDMPKSSAEKDWELQARLS